MANTPVAPDPGVSPDRGRGDLDVVARGAGVSVFGKIAGRITHLTGQVLFARMLGPEAFGLYALGFTCLRVITLLTPLGMPRAGIYFGSRYWRKDTAAFRGVAVQTFSAVAVSGLLTGLLLYFAAPWLAASLFEKPGLAQVLRWFAVAVPLATALTLASDLTRVSQRVKFAVFAFDLAPPAAALALFLLLYAAGYRLFGALAATTCSFGVGLALALYYLRGLFPELLDTRTRPRLFPRELLSFALPATLGGIFTMFIVWFDRLFVGYFLTSADVGVYQAASQSSVIFAIILAGFRTISTPMIARLHSEGESARIGEIFSVSTRWGLYLSVPVLIVICRLPREIMSAVFGPDYVGGALPFLVLAIGQFINMGTGNVDLLLIMSGHEKRWFALSGSMLVVNILLCVTLIPAFGLLGAACATSFSVAALFVVALIDVRRTLGLWPYDRRYLKAAAAASITVAVVWAADAALGGATELIRVLAACAVAPSAFLALVFALGIEAEDRAILEAVRRRALQG